MQKRECHSIETVIPKSVKNRFREMSRMASVNYSVSPDKNPYPFLFKPKPTGISYFREETFGRKGFHPKSVLYIVRK